MIELVGIAVLVNIISKQRFVIPINDNLKCEVDVFSGKHIGTIVAEVELSEPDIQYKLPSILGTSENIIDVTNKKEYKNWYMAGL